MDIQCNNSSDVLSVLEYPFDANYILSKKKRIRRRLLELNRDYTEKKIAILGGYTTNDIKLVLELFLLYHGVKPTFYESEYNHYYEDAMFPNQQLEQFQPDVIYICTSNRNITSFPQMPDSVEDIDNMLSNEYQRFEGMWNHLREVYKCPIIQNNFELPTYRFLSNRDAYDIHGAVNYITRLNMQMYYYAQKQEDFFICDINYISADYGLKEWSDSFYWYMYKYALNISAIPYLSFNVANIIKSIFGKNKKGMVLDLDNTLWGGVIGDDGVENIHLGPEDAEGQAYQDFQDYIRKHKQLGCVLNINSKNEKENAIAGLQHPNAILQEEDFVEIRANWEPKNRNHIDIAQALQLLPESLVFVDDNPAEREIVREQRLGISAPDMGEVHQYIHRLDRSGFFEVTNLSEDDLNRSKMYQDNAQRSKLALQYTDYKEYLLSLEMSATVKPFEAVYMSRIAQLTNKSNQFNLTTKRYTQTQIEQIANGKNYITLYGKLEDKYGDNGVVSIVIGRIEETVCHVDLWLMSCRVLKRDMEYCMMDQLVNACNLREITIIKGYYYPTEKNKMVQNFYHTQGFSKIKEESDGTSVWEYKIPSDYVKKNDVIKVRD